MHTIRGGTSVLEIGMKDQDKNIIVDEFVGYDTVMEYISLTDEQRETLNKNGSLRLPDGSIMVSTTFKVKE